MEIRGTDEDTGTVRVEFDTDQSVPSLSVVAAVAEITDEDEAELSPVYDCIDHLVDHVFSNPPDTEADVVVSFTYEGYRVTSSRTATPGSSRSERPA
jgi:hypothetical protein